MARAKSIRSASPQGENAATILAAIDNLVERRLDPAARPKALSKAIRRTFTRAAAIHRCQAQGPQQHGAIAQIAVERLIWLFSPAFGRTAPVGWLECATSERLALAVVVAAAAAVPSAADRLERLPRDGDLGHLKATYWPRLTTFAPTLMNFPFKPTIFYSGQ
jgi:hypothetical protein